LDASLEAGPRRRRLTLNLDFSARRLWAASLLLLSAWIIHGFLLPLVWASVIAVATWPMYRRFAARMPAFLASTVTPLLFTMLVSAFVLAPMVFAFGVVAIHAHALLGRLAQADKIGFAAPIWLESLPLVGARLAERWQSFLGTPGGLSTWLRDSSALLGWVQTLGQFVAHHLFVVVFTILVQFFLYRGGDPQALRLNRLLRDALGESATPYLELAIHAMRATVVGMVLVALFDGVLIGLVYVAAGVPHAVAWAAVTGLFSLIPYLGYVAVVGVALSLGGDGAVTSALVVCSLGCLVHLVGDKIIRPILVGGAVKLGFIWVLMASLGGLELMGLVGVLVGPVVLALASSLWREWSRNRDRSSTRLASAAPTESD
jgi:predicted PurR-regulated permease PerM